MSNPQRPCTLRMCVPTGPAVGPGCTLVSRNYPNGKICGAGGSFCESCLEEAPVNDTCTEKGCSTANLPPVGDYCRNVMQIYPNGKGCDKDYFCEYCGDDMPSI